MTKLAVTLRPIPSKRLGFTLVELVLVIVIMSIVMAIAQPKLASFLINDRVRRAGERVAMDLRLAQSEAIKQQTIVTVTFDATNDSYTLTGLSPDSTGATTRTVNLASDSSYRSHVSDVDFDNGSVLKFDSFGVPDNGGTFVLSVGRMFCTITVDAATGRPTVSALSYTPPD